MDILKAFPVRLALVVGIPLILAIATGGAAAWGGWKGLVDKFISEKQAEINEERNKETVRQFNLAYDRIDGQEANLDRTKEELEKQETITASLKAEYIEQKKFNELLNQIQLLSLGVRNGSRENFEGFYSLVEGDKLNKDLNAIWQTEYKSIRKLWESELEKVNLYYLNDDKGKRRKWSLEYLYSGISKLGTSQGWVFANKDILAFFKEIELSKSPYFVQTLYQIAIESKNINIAILAAKTLCEITKSEPYPKGGFSTPYKRLLADIPRFDNLKKWWQETGSSNKMYICPFEKIVEYDRNYYSFDRSHKDKDLNPDRLKLLNSIIQDYPLLQRTKAEIAYLKLNGPDTFEEVEQLALEAIKGSDTEPLPYLINAFIGLQQRNPNKLRVNLVKASILSSEDQVYTCIQINPKLHELFRKDLTKYMPKK